MIKAVIFDFFGVIVTEGLKQFLDTYFPNDPKKRKEAINDVVLSYRFGMAKPKQEIYELAAERLNVLTTECVFVDDSPSHCEGAKRSGMKTVWYEDFPQVKKDLEKILSSGSHN
jgi:beta-phosphoglucomutase-like phosphatase (HAD superfamily)